MLPVSPTAPKAGRKPFWVGGLGVLCTGAVLIRRPLGHGLLRDRKAPRLIPLRSDAPRLQPVTIRANCHVANTTAVTPSSQNVISAFAVFIAPLLVLFRLSPQAVDATTLPNRVKRMAMVTAQAGGGTHLV
jgi:hypothetical protein